MSCNGVLGCGKCCNRMWMNVRMGCGWGVGMYSECSNRAPGCGWVWMGFGDDVLGVNRVCGGRVSHMWRNVPEAGRL